MKKAFSDLSKYICHILLFSLFVFSPITIWGAPASPNIPLDSWIYPALDKLEGLGLVDSGLGGNRPYTRFEAARRVEEAAWRVAQADNSLSITSQPDDSISATTREILSRLEKEFDFELHQTMGQTSGYIKPVRDLELTLLYHDADSSSATASTLFYNNNGIDFQDGANLLLSFESEIRLGSWLLFDARPLILADTSEDGDASIEFMTATATLALGPMAVSYGKQSLWWGQGRHGTLALTNNTAPLTMARLTNPSPIMLPWVFRLLGPFRMDLFWTRLEKDRVISEPHFMGMRVNIVPIPSLELGASHTTMFGGNGQPETEFEDFLTVFPGISLSREDSSDKQLTTLDFRLQLPLPGNPRLYGEIAGGGKNASNFSDTGGWIAGIYLPQIEPSGRTSLRFEYADLTGTSSNQLRLYSDADYLSGYTYKGNTLGHHAGNAARDYFTEIEFRFSGDLTLTGSLDYEIIENDSLEQETHLQGILGANWWYTETLSLRFNIQIDQYDDYNFTPGDKRTFSTASAGIVLHW